MPPVTVYSKPGCAPCRMTKMHLNKAGVDFTEIDLSQDTEALDKISSMGYQAAPVVTVGDEDSWSGFRMDKIKQITKRVTAPLSA